MAENNGPDNWVDFNVHNLLGIRLCGASAGDAKAVERHLGLPPAQFPGEPALTIRYVDRISVKEPLRYLGREDVAFTNDDFIMLRSRDLARACARLEVEKIGTSCEMVCETGLPAVPLLRPLLNMLMLARGVVPIHAAAFRYRERGVLVTGWSYGSKTGSLLAFMARGAKFVGDEWIYVSPADDRMYGLPDQLEARSWYLRELPQVRRHVGLADRVRTKVAAGAASLLGPLAAGAERRNTLTSKLVRQIHQKLHDQQSIHMRPRTLFGGDCILESPLDIVIVAVSHEAEEILVRPDSIEQAVARMAASFLAEQASLTSLYQKYLFAFPDRRNPLLDQVELIYRKHLLEGLAGKRAYTMLHPYPVTIAALQEAIEPLFSEGILTPSAGLNPRLSPSNG